MSNLAGFSGIFVFHLLEGAKRSCNKGKKLDLRDDILNVDGSGKNHRGTFAAVEKRSIPPSRRRTEETYFQSREVGGEGMATLRG